MGPPIYIGGNTVQSYTTTPVFSASMGPPIYIGGNITNSTSNVKIIGKLQWGHRFISVETRRKPRRSRTLPRRFNGATDLYRWKRSRGRDDAPRPDRFNGATDLYRWKQIGGVPLLDIQAGLQWGHRFISVETVIWRISTPGFWRCFNGATDLYRWKRVGPVLTKLASNLLQWGHRFISVETGAGVDVPEQRRGASMGPPIYIGGNRLLHRPPPRGLIASMGPPIYIGGNRKKFWRPRRRSKRFNGATDLYRWKRVRIPPEIAVTPKLQWGHRFISVETAKIPQKMGAI